MNRNKLFLYSLTSLSIIASNLAFAEEFATAPSLEGGFEAMIGGFLAVPSVDNTTYYTEDQVLHLPTNNNVYTAYNLEGQYEVGIQAAIGYVFPQTANSIELSWRNYDSAATDSASYNGYIDSFFIDGINDYDINGNQQNSYEDWDLMISQFLDIGTHVQLRFLGGISYLSKLDQTTKAGAVNSGLTTNGDDRCGTPTYCTYTEDAYSEYNSSYTGLGPRLGLDGRYDFGEAAAGFGIVGGFSVAYFLGDLDLNADGNINTTLTNNETGETFFEANNSYFDTSPNTINNHAVTNLRANLGIDYVYFFDNEELSTLGLELGYEVDTYLDGIGQAFYNPDVLAGQSVYTGDVTFSGPYLNLKGVF